MSASRSASGWWSSSRWSCSSTPTSSAGQHAGCGNRRGQSADEDRGGPGRPTAQPAGLAVGHPARRGHLLPDTAVRGAAVLRVRHVRSGLQPGGLLRRAHPVGEAGRRHHGGDPRANGADHHLRAPAAAEDPAAAGEHHDPADRDPPGRADPRRPRRIAPEPEGDALPAGPHLRGAGDAVRVPLARRRAAGARPENHCRCVQLARAGWPVTLWRVILPNLRTAVLSATVLTVALALGEFTMASLDQYQTFPVWIVNFDQTSGPVSVASGCGKTTALRILAGFEIADAGSVTVNGKDISPVPAAKRDMGMVFQSYSLFPNMSAMENVGFGLRMRRMAAAERKRRAGELLEMVGLTEHARHYPHQLSGGQQQRVALARALAIEPQVLLLDEPLSALDAKVRLQLQEQIRSMQQRLGTTTLFVTHDQEEALSMADRVGVMKEGKLEQIAMPDHLYAHPATAFVAEFAGTMNRVPGELTDAGQVRALGTVVPVHGDQPGGALTEVDVLVRPEGLKIEAVPGGNGIVTGRAFLGSVTRISVRLSGDVTVKVAHPSADAGSFAPGTSVRISLPGAAVLVTQRR